MPAWQGCLRSAQSLKVEVGPTAQGLLVKPLPQWWSLSDPLTEDLCWPSSVGLLYPPQVLSGGVPGAKWGLEMRGDEHRAKGGAPRAAARPPAGGAARTPLNEVVCGAMMLAYERVGKWNEVRFSLLLCGLTLVCSSGLVSAWWRCPVGHTHAMGGT